ncbi:MAG: lysine exporter LysO family protein [Bacteroidales bacterium]|nr:lysine exporter LysO family protein [Bacteroidales bacterium]
MFKVIACMAAGMVVGRFLRIKGLQKPIIAVTWLLLLFLGLETGSDREVIGALPSIGLASAALSIGGVAGSCILAWLLWKYMGGNVGDAVPESGQGARETGAGGDLQAVSDGDLQAVSGGDLQAVSGLDMGTGRRISVWSGMGGSLVILGFFTLGIILGLAGLPAGQSIVHKLSFWSLCILMAMVGMSVGGNPELVSSIRSMNPRIALLPIATILGTYAGCIIVNLFLGHSIADVLAIGSGFGYYSLSSVLISSSRGPHLGSIALISNIIREVFTLLCAPLLARIAGPLAPISSGGATTADTTLPIISSCCGDKFVLISIFHGFAVDFTVPFLVTLFCSLGQ